ncbi:hypothetical protein ASG52_16160 [Methylobacterium sp. Leaf456]|uniref:hypothetical protein n=1 Tax=Methylobacterium sp. Leaf456 TaxID=1736382 RepID=UPI000701EDD1|nr:hypothetical protein [Methylobacterium sp. Leaf456]KQT60791.1 hypothetical protein ASG52_16160 [Methylobacterium sp. Leaf456]
MRKFITTRPEAASGDFGSPYDPVLAGVAQGLSRLFPPIRQAGPARTDDRASAGDAEIRRHAAASRGGRG